MQCYGPSFLTQLVGAFKMHHGRAGCRGVCGEGNVTGTETRACLWRVEALARCEGRTIREERKAECALKREVIKAV